MFVLVPIFNHSLKLGAHASKCVSIPFIIIYTLCYSETSFPATTDQNL